MDRSGAPFAYLELFRVSNLPTVWTNVLAASLLALGRFDPRVLPVAASLSFFYLAGMALNDLCDRDIDRAGRPSRPIPSGRVTVAGARSAVAALALIGFLPLLAAPSRLGAAASLVLALAILWYDLDHKENPWSVLVMASCRLLVFVVAALALAGELAGAVLAAGGAQFSYVVLVSLVARREPALGKRCALPVVPLMIAGMSLLDGAAMAVVVGPFWGMAGIAGFLATLWGQRYVRGD